MSVRMSFALCADWLLGFGHCKVSSDFYLWGRKWGAAASEMYFFYQVLRLHISLDPFVVNISPVLVPLQR